ncbi:hypothetical protein KEM56_001335 [Ascosphaera pollenicola]|nr:hypothetical protein KEM56_001335 [Ascosphaera pollenicola]
MVDDITCAVGVKEFTTFRKIAFSWRTPELDTAADSTSETYKDQLRNAINKLEECQNRIAQVSLFSSNESLEDINTSDLPYLTVDYHLAELLQRSYGEDRLKSLRSISSVYDSFLERLDNYGLLSAGDKKLYEQYVEHPQTFTLAPASNPAARRETKISRFTEEKKLKETLKYYRKNSKSLQADDETVRKLYLAEIKLFTHQTFQTLDMVTQEASMLAMISANPPPPPPSQQQLQDMRKPGLLPPGHMYSDRLDVGLSGMLDSRNNGPLLSKTGVPLRTFTLTDKKSELQKGVFKSGHNLPTMSIDEYLDEERRRGNIIEGGGEASGQAREVDEDDLELADAETYKAREWDEFKEANPKGAGNTLNRG